MKENQYQLIATAAFGLEAIVAKEVRDLGYENVEVENGKVMFQADAAGIARANLWLRSADRVKWQVGQFRATSFDELFEQTKALPWGEILPRNAEFPVIGKSVKSQLFSVSDCQAIVKKAIVEKMKMKFGMPWFPEDGPLYRIEVSLLKDIATLSIDTSGDGLHKRGYRQLHNEAPLKETMAAALIQLTNWKPNRPFHDPFCGSGTIPIEAALIGQNIAPGFNRNFISQTWRNFPKEIWDQALEEAEDLARYDQPLEIMGTDIDRDTIELANHNAQEAGFADLIKFKQVAVADLRTDLTYGYLVGNPPYGERLKDVETARMIYRQLAATYERSFPTWSLYIFTADEEFEEIFGKPATKKRKLYNGRIRCDYYQYYGPRPPRDQDGGNNNEARI